MLTSEMFQARDWRASRAVEKQLDTWPAFLYYVTSAGQKAGMLFTPLKLGSEVAAAYFRLRIQKKQTYLPSRA